MWGGDPGAEARAGGGSFKRKEKDQRGTEKCSRTVDKFHRYSLRTGIGEYWYCCGIYNDGAGHGYIIGANV